MHKLKIIFFLLLICDLLQAQEYQLEEIENIAYNFLNSSPRYTLGNDSQHPIKQISSIEAISRDNKNYLYIVNTEASSGWVILSNERMYSSIIAHGDNGSFIYDDDILPPALLCILNKHMDAIDSVRNDNRISSRASSTTPTVVYKTSNLIGGDKWRQFCNNDSIIDDNKIYNKFVPHNHSSSCQKYCGKDPVGCGPVAMAKVMRYWQWPDYAYIGGVHDTTYYYDWTHMPTEIDDNTDMYTVDAVAHLFRSCGQAAVTAYTCSGSATIASEIHSAMTNEFRFHANLVNERNIDVAATLINEIDQGRPVIVQAHENNIFDGHSFVVDGYELYSDGSAKFHIHWGWGSDNFSTTNFYDINFDGYTKGQQFLIEIYPLCNSRNDDVSLFNTFTVNENQTYYSTNNVIVCSNNNSIIVNEGGHLLIKAGNRIHLKNGFHARNGSNVHLKIDSLCYAPPEMQSSSYYTIVKSSINKNTNATFIDDEEDITLNIKLTSTYTLCGQLIQIVEGENKDINNLPQGIYILQFHMSDGSIKCEKVRN